MSESRQKMVLGAILVVLGLIVGLRVLPAFGGSGENWWQQGARGVELEDDLRVEVLELQTARLMAEPREFRIGRDPWRFGEAPKPVRKAPPPKPKPPPEPTPKTVEVDPEPDVPTTPAKPRPPAVDVTFLGTFGPSDRQIAVFFDGDAIYNASRGDVLNEKFQVVEIGLESVDLGFVGFPDEPPARLAIGG